jgi:hypothetical protein
MPQALIGQSYDDEFSQSQKLAQQFGAGAAAFVVGRSAA